MMCTCAYGDSAHMMYAPVGLCDLPGVQRTREVRKALSHKLQDVIPCRLGSGILEELYQLLVEQSGHRRRPCLRKFAEECRR